MKAILLVEDDRGIREALEEVLKVENYTVYTAENGKRALEIIQDTAAPKIDLILLDLMMPIMSGQEFLEKIETLDPRAISKTPIAVFSANGRPSDLKSNCVAEVIRKPVDLDAFLEVVEKNCALS